MNTSSPRPKKGDRIDFILQLWFFVLAIGSIIAFSPAVAPIPYSSRASAWQLSPYVSSTT